MTYRWGNNGNSYRLFWGVRKSLQMVTVAKKLKGAFPWKKSYDHPGQYVKKQRHYFANKGPSSQSYGFSSSHVQMWELDNKKGGTRKNWCPRTVVRRRLPWIAKRSNQSILKKINPYYSLEELILKLQYLATWCEELTHWKRSWCWERLKAGGEGDDRG